MKIHGWEKIWKTGDRLRWDNKTTKNSIVIQENHERTHQNVVFYNNIGNKVLDYFNTKQMALKYAIEYMKKNPIA